MQAFQELHGRIEKVSQKDGQKQGDDDPGSVVEKEQDDRGRDDAQAEIRA
jgi:hypothetical protein